MPTRWSDWVHAIISTRGSWLPGDPRGFRDHDHRVHSSGDYKHRPAVGEHAGLHRWAASEAHGAIVFPRDLRAVIAQAMGRKLIEMCRPPRIIAIAGGHGHLLIKVGPGDAKSVVGRAKQRASHAVRLSMPGRIWAQGCHAVRIEREAHYRAVVGYIEEHTTEGAALWVHPRWRDPDLRGASDPAS